MIGRVLAGYLALVWVALFLHEAGAQECSKNPECTCYFGKNKGPVILQGTGSDTKSLGLSAATGALSSLVLAGGGIALWKHFKGRSSAINDVYGRPPSSHGSWMEDRKYPITPRRGSFPFSDDGYDPTGKMRGISNPTNIYKHGGAVWPGVR